MTDPRFGNPTDGYLIPILQRPKRVDCATWAELNRFMPSTHTLFSFLQTPFFREPTRYLSDLAGTSRVILCTPAQVGKTTAIENFLGWIATYDRANTLLIFDRLKTGQKMSKNRLRPFLRDTCGINATGQAGTKYRNPDASKEVCNISLATGANLMIGSSSSASDLCSTPAKFLCCDELDRWKDELKGEGDPVALALQRQMRFRGMALFTSTPTVEEGRINQHFLLGTQETWGVVCSGCGAWFDCRWDSIDWAGDVPTVHCPKCGEVFDEMANLKRNGLRLFRCAQYGSLLSGYLQRKGRATARPFLCKYALLRVAIASDTPRGAAAPYTDSSPVVSSTTDSASPLFRRFATA